MINLQELGREMGNEIEFLLKLRDEMLSALYSVEQRLQQMQKLQRQGQAESPYSGGILGAIKNGR